MEEKCVHCLVPKTICVWLVRLHPAVINFTVWKGNTGLVVLCFRVGRVCQLIAAGIGINSWDSEDSKNTPLHWAACYGNRDIVTCLIGGCSKSCCTYCHWLHKVFSKADSLSAGQNPNINETRSTTSMWKVIGRDRGEQRETGHSVPLYSPDLRFDSTVLVCVLSCSFTFCVQWNIIWLRSRTDILSLNCSSGDFVNVCWFCIPTLPCFVEPTIGLYSNLD